MIGRIPGFKYMTKLIQFVSWLYKQLSIYILLQYYFVILLLSSLGGGSTTHLNRILIKMEAFPQKTNWGGEKKHVRFLKPPRGVRLPSHLSIQKTRQAT